MKNLLFLMTRCVQMVLQWRCKVKELKLSTASVRRYIETRWHRTPSKVTGLILNWRGLWHGKSAKTSLAMGLSQGHLAVCCVKALTWTHSIWRSWKRTGMRRTWWRLRSPRWRLRSPIFWRILEKILKPNASSSNQRQKKFFIFLKCSGHS